MLQRCTSVWWMTSYSSHVSAVKTENRKQKDGLISALRMVQNYVEGHWPVMAESK